MVFDYGDPGDKFFIILKGSVSIQIPTKAPVPEAEQEIRLTMLQELETKYHWAMQKYHNELDIFK